MKERQNKRVFLLELSMSGVYHVGVNTGLLEVAARVFPGHDLVFRGEKTHVQAVKERVLAERAIRFRPWPSFPKVSLRTLLLRDLLGCWYAGIALLRSRRGDIFFLTNLLPLTHRWLCSWNRLFRRELFICLHGQLEALLPGSPLRGTKRYFGLHKKWLRRDTKSYYILLGEPVFADVTTLFSPKSRTIVIDHPYDYECLPTDPPDYVLPLRLGQIGSGNRGKGTQRLFELAELLREEIGTGKIEIHLLGRLDPGLTYPDNGLVHYSDRPLPDIAFRKKIASLHYSLFLRGENESRGVPSGSFFDAVKYGKPYLSLQNGFVSYYHRRFPETGSLFSSTEEMAAAIRQRVVCVESGEQEYYQKVKAFDPMREYLSYDRIAESLRKQLE